MREGFSEQLQEYSEKARQEIAAGVRHEEAGSSHQEDGELSKLELRFAEQEGNLPEDQDRIYRLQVEKQRIMQGLKHNLAELDKRNPNIVWPKNSVSVKLDEITDSLKVQGRDYLTAGELLTDAEWGMQYSPGNSVPRALRKRYLVELAKLELRKLLDEQITIAESTSDQVDDFKKKAYLAREAEPEETKNGLIAERLVRVFLKKLVIDLGADFLLEEADIYQDVQEKIDFIISRKNRRRGVGVAAKEDITSIGIQFTTSQSESTLGHKEEQIKRSRMHLKSGSRVSDIFLISIPLRDVQDLLSRWKRNPRPGGPDKLLPAAQKTKIIRGVLEGILAPAEIDAICYTVGTVKN